MSAHTPGPWKMGRMGDGLFVSRMEGKVRGANIAKVATTARMVAEGGTAEAEANARLIAAAPDLLAALVSIARYAQVDLWAQDEWEKACEVALAAIAKARGTP